MMKTGKRIWSARWTWRSLERMLTALRSCSSGESSRSDVHGMTTMTPLIGQNFR
jgi:hypothetical protein